MSRVEILCRLNDGRIVRARYEEEHRGEWSLWAFFDAEWVRVGDVLSAEDVHIIIERLKASGNIAWYKVIWAKA